MFNPRSHERRNVPTLGGPPRRILPNSRPKRDRDQAQDDSLLREEEEEPRQDATAATTTTPVKRSRGFRHSPPPRRDGKPAIVPNVSDIELVTRQLSAVAPQEEAAAEDMGGAVYWKDVHGIKLETLKEIDGEVGRRRCRVDSQDSAGVSLSFAMGQYFDEQNCSTRQAAISVYRDAKFKFIWFQSSFGPKNPLYALFFGIQSAYLKHMKVATLEEAFAMLPDNDQRTRHLDTTARTIVTDRNGGNFFAQ